MERKELLQIAKRHGFGGFEVGCRMRGLIDEVEQLAVDAAYSLVREDIATLEQENRQLRARIARLVDCAGAHHAAG